MNATLIGYCLASNIGFLLYLTLLRVDFALIVRIFLTGFLWSLPVALISIIVLPWLIILAPIASFKMMLMVFNPIVMAFVIVSKAREAITPRISAVELVCLNVAAPFAASGSFISTLLNPFWQFGALLPQPFTFVLHWLIVLWPTWLVVAMIRRKRTQELRLRFLLVIWMQAIYIALLLGPATAALAAFSGSTTYGYLVLTLNSFALIQIVLTAISLWTLWRGGSDLISVPKNPAQFLAERLRVSEVSLNTIGVTIVLTYVLGYVLRRTPVAREIVAAIMLTAPIIVGGLIRRAFTSDTAESDADQSDDEAHAVGTQLNRPRSELQLLTRLWKMRVWILISAALFWIFWATTYSRSSGAPPTTDPVLNALRIACGIPMLFIVFHLAAIVLDSLGIAGRILNGKSKALLMLFAAMLFVGVHWSGGRLYDPQAVAKRVMAVELGEFYEQEFYNPVTQRVGRGLFYKGRYRPASIENESICADTVAESWVGFRALGPYAVECQWSTITDDPDESVRTFNVCLHDATQCQPSATFRAGVEGIRLTAVDDMRKLSNFQPQDFCKVEEWKLVCGKWSDHFSNWPQGVWPRPNAWDRQSIEIKLHSLEKGVRLICAQGGVTGEIAGVAPEALYGLAVVTFDLYGNPLSQLRMVYDEHASCDRLVQAKRGDVYYLVRRSTAQSVNRGFVVLLNEFETRPK
jgi:hypothetical protein